MGRNALGCFCPSEIPYYHDPARKAPALTREQIQQKIDQMIATAVLLRQCGFPGIEVRAMHWGYLLDQFALSFMNHRTDEYGRGAGEPPPAVPGRLWRGSRPPAARILWSPCAWR